MKRKVMFLLSMVTSIVFLSGCWDKKELTDLAIISAMSVDKTKEGNYTKTLQIVNPGNVAGGLQGGGGGSNPPITTFTAEGKTILEAHAKMSEKISRLVYHPHAVLLVVSEELARDEGLYPILDAFDRNTEIRTTTNIIIARETKAEDLIKNMTAIDKISALKITRTMEFTEKFRGAHMMVTLQDFLKAGVSPGIEPVVSGFSLSGDVKKGKKMENVQQSELDATIEANGLAVFKDGKLIDWYEDKNSKGVTWIQNKIKNTDVELEWEGKKEAIAYDVTSQKTSISADTKNATPSITVKVLAEGAIREVTTPVKLDDPKTIFDLEDQIEKDIRKQLETTVKQTQKNKSDVLGFGEAVHLEDPKKWKKMKDKWNDAYFPKVKVTVEVDAFVRNTGVRTNSYISSLKKK